MCKSPDRLISLWILPAALLAGVGAVQAFAQGGDLAGARRTLMAGRTDEAIAELQKLGANGPAQLLLCRAYLSKEDIDNAVHACEAAVRSMPDDSVAQDWMGRAYGSKADHAGPLAGYSLAKKVVAAFEAAVRLDPKNGDAADDLGEFYVAAPGMVGGGLDRAMALEKQLEGTMPERAQRLRAEIAEKSKDYGTAEREFRTLASARNEPDGWADLAGYYVRHKQFDQAAETARQSIALNHKHDASLVAAAGALEKAHKDTDAAIAALRSYLAGNEMTDSGPACKAHTLLGRLLVQKGDRDGARAEFQTALTLASGYPPAQRALAAL